MLLKYDRWLMRPVALGSHLGDRRLPSLFDLCSGPHQVLVCDHSQSLSESDLTELLALDAAPSELLCLCLKVATDKIDVAHSPNSFLHCSSLNPPAKASLFIIALSCSSASSSNSPFSIRFARSMNPICLR